MTPSVSLRLLRYFRAAAESGSTTIAARHLNVSQPAISVAIRDLESIFKEALFARGVGTVMTLTRFGERKLAEARELLTAASAFEADDAGDGTEGEVQIGVFSTISPVYLPTILRVAQSRFPNLKIRFMEGDLEQIEVWLRASRIEMALTYEVSLPSDIERECLAELRPYGLVPTSFNLAKSRKRISIRDLAREPFILIDLPHSRDFLMTPFWQFGCVPDVRYRATSIELVRAMVANELGVSLLITQAPANALTSGTIELPIREATIRQPLVIARRVNAVRTRASELLAECIREAVKESNRFRIIKSL